jgi:hypothetical protein
MLTEPTSSHANCLKTRRLPPVGCTLCWVLDGLKTRWLFKVTQPDFTMISKTIHVLYCDDNKPYSGFHCLTRSSSCSGVLSKFLAISGWETVSCSAPPISPIISVRNSGRLSQSTPQSSKQKNKSVATQFADVRPEGEAK